MVLLVWLDAVDTIIVHCVRFSFALITVDAYNENFNIVNSADFEFKFMGKRNMNAIYMSVIY